MKAPRFPAWPAHWAAPVLLAAGLACSFGLARLVQLGQESRAGQNLATLADSLGRQVRNDIEAYGTTLRGLQGLFINSPRVDRVTFRRYVDNLRLQHDAALLHAFFLMERVEPGERAAFEAAARRDPAFGPDGLPQFKIVPLEDRPTGFFVSYLDPLPGRETLLGQDVGRLPAGREALERLMAGGAMTLSSPFPMNRTAAGATGLLLMLPLYASDEPARPYAGTGRRTTALLGIAINIDKALQDIAEPLALRHVRLKLFELERSWEAEGAAGGRTLFDNLTGEASAGPAYLRAASELDVLGNRWRVEVRAEPASMPPGTRYGPEIALALSLTLTLLLYLLVRSLGRVGTLAAARAERMTGELRRSEAMFRDLAELSSDWYWEQDEHFRFTAMSGGVVNKGNFRIDASLGRTRWELPVEGIGEAEWARHRAQLERHEPFRDFVYRIRADDGLLHWYAASGNPVFDEDGRFVGYRGTGRDITRSTEAEQALRESEVRLNKAQEVARLGSWHLDIAANRLEWSRETYRLFGIAPETPLTYELFLSCVHPDDRAQVAGAWDGALAGRPYGIEHRIVVGGETRWVHELAEIAFGGDGQATSATGTVLDITERKRTEQQLRLAATVFEHSLEGVIITDGEGAILSVNRAFSAITGYAPEEVIGRNPRLLQSGRHDAAFYRAVWDSIGSRGHWRGEVWNKRKNGETYPELLGICAVPDAAGRPSHYVGVFTDIGELKRSEAAMRRFNAELERRVEERTAALTASNRELEAFSYSVSHDLRAPLRAIDGFAHILAEDYAERFDAAAHGHLRRIRDASQRMALVIDDMLELARLARTELHRGDVDLSALAATVVRELPEEAGRRVEAIIAPDLHASADRGLMHIVLQNLIHNAWKFTGLTDAARIEFGEAAIDGERAFFVRDNGAGFDPAHAGRLFGAFQRLHRPDEFAGTGIGLATVQRIVERHGGRVRAEGAVGRGATFYFTLGERAGE